MVFPELLAGILARDALQDLRAAWVFVYEASDVVHILVDDNILRLRILIVRRNIRHAESLGHGACKLARAIRCSLYSRLPLCSRLCVSVVEVVKTVRRRLQWSGKQRVFYEQEEEEEEEVEEESRRVEE